LVDEDGLYWINLESQYSRERIKVINLPFIPLKTQKLIVDKVTYTVIDVIIDCDIEIVDVIVRKES